MCARVACVCLYRTNRQPQRSASLYTHASYRQAVGRLQSVIMNLVLDSCAAAAVQPSVCIIAAGNIIQKQLDEQPKRKEQSYNNNTRNISSLCPEPLLDALYVHNLSPDYTTVGGEKKESHRPG